MKTELIESLDFTEEDYNEKRAVLIHSFCRICKWIFRVI